jgi:hypothetical protein
MGGIVRLHDQQVPAGRNLEGRRKERWTKYQ